MRRSCTWGRPFVLLAYGLCGHRASFDLQCRPWAWKKNSGFCSELSKSVVGHYYQLIEQSLGTSNMCRPCICGRKFVLFAFGIYDSQSVFWFAASFISSSKHFCWYCDFYSTTITRYICRQIHVQFGGHKKAASFTTDMNIRTARNLEIPDQCSRKRCRAFETQNEHFINHNLNIKLYNHAFHLLKYLTRRWLTQKHLEVFVFSDFLKRQYLYKKLQTSHL